jgi:hypothetical protein
VALTGITIIPMYPFKGWCSMLCVKLRCYHVGSLRGCPASMPYIYLGNRYRCYRHGTGQSHLHHERFCYIHLFNYQLGAHSGSELSDSLLHYSLFLRHCTWNYHVHQVVRLYISILLPCCLSVSRPFCLSLLLMHYTLWVSIHKMLLFNTRIVSLQVRHICCYGAREETAHNDKHKNACCKMKWATSVLFRVSDEAVLLPHPAMYTV